MKFFKYHGAGNDFIIVNAINDNFNLSSEKINELCDRHFGIGADGLMILKKHDEYDFEMIYYNADGKEGTMCGNGGRCIVAFAKKNELIENYTKFLAIDGEHEAYIDEDNIVKLKMQNVENIEINSNYYFLNTGSPHYVEFVENIDNFDVYNIGKKIRHKQLFSPNGTNVNFGEIENNFLKIRTFERGVENETLACGTGTVALAISYALKLQTTESPIYVKALGGDLKVFFEKQNNKFINIWLEGPTKFVFLGEI